RLGPPPGSGQACQRTAGTHTEEPATVHSHVRNTSVLTYRSPESMMIVPTWSFMLPVRLADSSFAVMRADPAGTTRRSSTRGVLPMATRTCRDVRVTTPWLP